MSKVSLFLVKQFNDSFIHAGDDGKWTFNESFYRIFKGNKRIRKKKAYRAITLIIEEVVLPHAREMTREGKRVDEYTEPRT